MNQQVSIAAAEPLGARFTAAEFAQIFASATELEIRLELIDGYLERMTPPMGAHSSRQTSVLGAIWMAMGEQTMVEAPIDLGGDTVVVCDVAVIREPMTEQRFLRADEVVLAVEISLTTLDRDLNLKRTAYARAGIPCYWVVDGLASRVHVFELTDTGSYGPAELVPFGRPLTIPGTDRTIVIG